MGRGRPRKPTSLHIADGTLRPFDHAGRALEPEAEGVPVCPDNLQGQAREFWERVVPQLVTLGVAKAIDQDALVSMARCWGWYQAAADLADIEPTDKEVRTAVVAYKAEWERAAARFGLTPVDRSKIQVKKAGPEKSKAAKYFG